MDVERRKHAAFDSRQKANQLHRVMPGLALADDVGGGPIDGGEQRGRAVPPVVVRYRGGATFLLRQAGLLAAVMRLISQLSSIRIISARSGGGLPDIAIPTIKL